MDTAETTKLCKAIATISPAQHFDADTPAVWSLILADVRYEDAREAVIQLARSQPFISPSEIIERVKAIRRERLENVTEADLTPDIGHGVHAADWVATLRARIALVADGAPVAQAIASVPPPKAITAGGES